MDSSLLSLLACPQCHGPLIQDKQALCCEACHLAYPIEDDLPVLLIEKAQPYPPAPAGTTP